MLVFVKDEKLEKLEKTPWSKARTNNKLIWHHARIEPGPHWWETSALTTVPSLPPCISCCMNNWVAVEIKKTFCISFINSKSRDVHCNGNLGGGVLDPCLGIGVLPRI